MSGDAKEIVEEYISSLTELTNNSKPLISMLTILAEDYIEHAPAIVEAVEAHLFKVSSEIKLPVLYLIDSIIKNVNKAYLRLFAKNIVNMFCHVFEKGNENTRMGMWKVRTTWNEVFPAKKLYALDVRVQKIDPAWPITSKLPAGTKLSSSKSSSKHREASAPAQPTPPVSKVSPVQPTATVTPTVVIPAPVVKLPTLTKPATATEAEMQQELIKKQKLLLELQKQKLDLELMQAKANLEQQRRQLDKQTTLLKPDLAVPPEDDLELTVEASTPSNNISNTLDKHPGAISLFKPTENKSGVRIAPASSIAVAAAKQIAGRDPRLKLPATVSKESIEELAKQKIMQHLNKLQQQNNASLSLNNESVVMATINNKTVENQRVDGSQKKDSAGSNSSLLNNNVVKDSSKNSSAKSSSSRGRSTRKIGCKTRSKTPSPSPSPTKSNKSDDNSPSPPEKRSKKSSKSRKARNPSPLLPSTASSNSNSSSSSYRIPKHSSALDAPGSNKSSLPTTPDDEEQSGSPPDSPPYDPAAPITSFKNLRSSTRHRNYIRRNKEGSRSPESGAEDAGKDVSLPDTSKDEDLRAPLGSVNVVVAAASAAALEKMSHQLFTEDLDLRVLAVPGGKRQNTDTTDASSAKKTKTGRFDTLFGSEDVDLRTLTNPNAGRPSTTPPPAIVEDKDKDNSWAKLKTPIKTENDAPRPLQDRNRDKLGRPRFYNKIGASPEDGKERRFRGPNMMAREFDKQNERNIEIIIKQAAEQLNQGEITKTQYNKLIQNVLHMSEDQKLRAAQRKEQEMGMLMWEKGEGPNIPGAAAVPGQILGNEENIRKDFPPVIPHPRATGPQSVPRWQGPWHPTWGPPPSHGTPIFTSAPPPPFPPAGGPPMGAPWQNHPRMFGPPPVRTEFPYPPPFNPRMVPPPPLGTNGPMMMPNGPINPTMAMGSMPGGLMSQMPPNMIMGNGPMRPDMQKRLSPTNSAVASASSLVNNVSRPETDMNSSTLNLSGGQVSSGELPSADPALLEEIAKDTMKSINIDNIPREIRYYGNIGIVFMNWDDPRDIGFQGGSRRIFINGKDSIVCNFNEDYKEFTYEGEIHRIKLGTPTRELYVDGKWYECYFGGRPITVDLGNKKVSINLEGPIPQVKIGTIRRTDLVIGKINLIINARNMVPVFLDSKPQMFEVEGVPCSLEFADALQTVLLNGKPFRVEFGGLPKPVIIGEKKHFIRFSVLPRGIRAGHVKITGMRGEQPNFNQSSSAVTSAVTTQTTSNHLAMASTKTTTTTLASSLTMPATSIASTPPANPNIPPGLDLDSTSQDGTDTPGSVSKSSDLQLDVLSSIVPSVMAPSSGLSYQAEPAENPQPAPAPAFSLPTNISELFQRLVETGIVPSLDLSKRQEEEERREPEMIPVSFDKPETLKMKQPAMVSALYTGMQCSSCGERFTPEMATHYSHHLDWHFRQNRKERDCAKKPQSRTWYYDIHDWTQFEEIEDLDERTQSWFETEKQASDADGAGGDNALTDLEQPSIPAQGPSPHKCEVCQEIFEQFFNEDIEEWHIRPAVTYEGKNYHPLCLQDHKISLEKSTSVLEVTATEVEVAPPKEDLEVEIEIKEEPIDEKPIIKEELIEMMEPIEEVPLLQPGEIVKSPKIEEEHIVDEMDDTELIEIIEPLPRKIEIEDLVDDSSEEETKESIREEIERAKEQCKKLEEKIPDDVPLIFENVRIKEEPVDEPESEVSVPKSAVVDTTQVSVKSSMDGNIELESSATMVTPTAPSKIRINMAKSVNTTVVKEAVDAKKKEKDVIKSTAPTPAPAKPLFPAAIKPSLQGKKLSILPTVEKGHELSALCSIM
ncbi:uncharacterized protein LOC106647177 isoform X2 [Copidosoma floridanum]|uniref:uncharacterized protein LOC106647177 isoform X2 n=1 Tax=Copidosoma floridanum TaxID=29053 RepID=UPI0006C9CA57|nr:uncharacterized protein LOC106647177 isoform X2 [Copidosoma floridanum]